MIIYKLLKNTIPPHPRCVPPIGSMEDFPVYGMLSFLDGRNRPENMD
jgi:hypothetical protein